MFQLYQNKELNRAIEGFTSSLCQKSIHVTASGSRLSCLKSMGEKKLLCPTGPNTIELRTFSMLRVTVEIGYSEYWGRCNGLELSTVRKHVHDFICATAYANV